MKNLLRLVCLLLLLGTMLGTVGCTAIAYNHNKDYALRDIAIRSNNPQVFQAYNNGDVIGMGVDLNALDFAFYDWKTTGLQLLGVVADVGAGIAISDVLDNAFNDGGSGSSHSGGSGSNTSGRDTIVINTDGNGNTTTVNSGTPELLETVP